MVKMVQITMETRNLVDHKGELGNTLRLVILYILRDSLFEVTPSSGPTNNKITPRTYMSTFLEAQQQYNYFPEVEDNFEEYAREYATLSIGFRRQVTLDQYCGIKYKGGTRSYHRGSNELEHGEGKMEIPTFDGLARTTMQAWV
jgi:hypothetical protein